MHDSLQSFQLGLSEVQLNKRFGRNRVGSDRTATVPPADYDDDASRVNGAPVHRDPRAAPTRQIYETSV